MSSTRRRRADATPGAAPFADTGVLRSILDAVPTRVTYLDRDRRYRFANREFYSFTGLTPDQVIGRTVSQVLGRRTALTTRPFILAAQQGRATRHLGWRDYPTGGRRYVDSVFAPVLDDDGTMRGYFVMARDLTEARIREEELATRSRQLEEILDATPARVCVTDLDRRYVYVNREFCSFAAKLPEEIIGRTSEDLVGPAVASGLEPLVRAAQEGHIVSREGWVDYRLNGRRFINYVFAPKRAPDGSVEGVILFMTDATELKQREEDLARRSTQLEAILAGIGDGVSIVDGQGRMVLGNRGFAEMFGFPESLLRPGTPIETVVHDRVARGIFYEGEADETPPQDIVSARVRGIREGRDGAEEALRFDGRTIAVRRSRLTDDTIVSTYTDVTARGEAERARRAQRDAVRRAAQMEAAATLLAAVGHEINNPLAIISAQALMLAEDAEGTPLAARAEAIRAAAERCGRIVHSLMRSARQRPRRREPVSLARAVEQGLDIAGYGLRAAGIRLDLDIAPDLPSFQGEPEQFAHLVANLVANAQHAFEGAATPAPRRLAIAVARERDALLLRVADNGPGIPPELRTRIFDSFFTTKPEGHGSGVGLALCRAVVDAHGGAISVEETPGGGATFLVRVPVPGHRDAEA